MQDFYPIIRNAVMTRIEPNEKQKSNNDDYAVECLSFRQKRFPVINQPLDVFNEWKFNAQGPLLC